MRTERIVREDGSLLAFEITSAWLTFRPLFRILRSVSGVSDVRRQYFKDDRVSFKFNGEPFVVYEPWGDSSRYWIGPVDTKTSVANAEPLWRAFDTHKAFPIQLFRRLLRREGV